MRLERRQALGAVEQREGDWTAPQMDWKGQGQGQGEGAGALVGRNGVLRAAGRSLLDVSEPSTCDPVWQRLCWTPGRPVCPRDPTGLPPLSKSGD